MADPHRRLDRMAAAVCEMEPVDWPAAEAEAANETQRAIVRNLRGVATIVEGHRRPTSSPAPVSLARSSAPVLGFDTVVRWIAAVQVLLGVVGAAWGDADSRPVPPLMAFVTMAAFAVVAAALRLSGRGDPRAHYLGDLFLVVASTFALRFHAWLDGIPVVARLIHLDAFLPWLLWRFVRHFPRVVHFGRIDYIAQWGRRLSLATGITLFTTALLLEVHPPYPPSPSSAGTMRAASTGASSSRSAWPLSSWPWSGHGARAPTSAAGWVSSWGASRLAWRQSSAP